MPYYGENYRDPLTNLRNQRNNNGNLSGQDSLQRGGIMGSLAMKNARSMGGVPSGDNRYGFTGSSTPDTGYGFTGGGGVPDTGFGFSHGSLYGETSKDDPFSFNPLDDLGGDVTTIPDRGSRDIAFPEGGGDFQGPYNPNWWMEDRLYDEPDPLDTGGETSQEWFERMTRTRGTDPLSFGEGPRPRLWGDRSDVAPGGDVTPGADVPADAAGTDYGEGFVPYEPYDQLLNEPGSYNPPGAEDSEFQKLIEGSYTNLLEGKSPAFEQNMRLAQNTLAQLSKSSQAAAERKAAEMGLRPGEPGYDALMEQSKEAVLSQGSNILSTLSAQNLAMQERAIGQAGQYDLGEARIGESGRQFDQRHLLGLLDRHELFSTGQLASIKGALGDTAALSQATTWTQEEATLFQQTVAQYEDAGYDTDIAIQMAQEQIALTNPNMLLRAAYAQGGITPGGPTGGLPAGEDIIVPDEPGEVQSAMLLEPPAEAPELEWPGIENFREQATPERGSPFSTMGTGGTVTRENPADPSGTGDTILESIVEGGEDVATWSWDKLRKLFGGG